MNRQPAKSLPLAIFYLVVSIFAFVGIGVALYSTIPHWWKLAAFGVLTVGVFLNGLAHYKGWSRRQ